MPGIWGDGQRGGIFGARVDPRLQAELERRAAAKRQEMATAQEPSLADQWHGSLANRILSAPSKLFGGLVVDPVMDLATLAGDVIHGRQPTMAADPQTGEFHTDPGLADRAMNAAGMLTLGAGAVPAEANSLRMGIKAYHGSPHDFERFDSSKIGTGEGAQAYGHGLYFAENEGVAKEYRNRLAPPANVGLASKPVTKKDIQAIAEELGMERSAATAANVFGRMSSSSSVDEYLARLAEIDPKELANFPGVAKEIENEHALVLELKKRGLDIERPNKGRMYEVNIAADPEHFLDWDKPLSEQSPKVKEAVGKFGIVNDNAIGERLKAISLEMDAMATDRDPVTNMMRNEKRWHDLAREREQLFHLWDAHQSGSKIYNAVVNQTDKARRGSMPYNQRVVEGSNQLREAGVSGIKYLDQGSRAAGEGSRNYVVFDEHLISILKKYGLPISAAGLAALSQLHPEEAQAAQQKGKR